MSETLNDSASVITELLPEQQGFEAPPTTPEVARGSILGRVARVAAYIVEPKSPDLSTLPRDIDGREMQRIIPPQSRAERVLNFIKKYRDGDNKEKIVSPEEATMTSLAMTDIVDGLLKNSKYGAGIGEGYQEVAWFYLPQFDGSRVNVGVSKYVDGPPEFYDGSEGESVKLSLVAVDSDGRAIDSRDRYDYQITHVKDGAKRRVSVSDRYGFPTSTLIAADMTEIEGIKSLLEGSKVRESGPNRKKLFKRH